MLSLFSQASRDLNLANDGIFVAKCRTASQSFMALLDDIH
jgi:hypothetical protein